MTLATGTKAPNVTLTNPKREAVTLDSFKGKKLVVAFFPGAFTSVCTKELCTFRDSLAAFNDLDAAVIGVSVDAPFSNGAFADQNKLNFPVLSDYKREATEAFGVAIPDFAGLPGYTASNRAVFVLDAQGIVRYTWIAPNPGVEPPYEDVKKAVAAIA
jgi:peroxiredoxin